MPPIPNFSPYLFTLTNPFSGSLIFNKEQAEGFFALDQAACDFQIGVRSTTDNVPQADGSILHTRFLTGSTISLTWELWENAERPACGAKLREMLDLLSGSLRSLLNAGDNEGRLAWQVAGTDDPDTLGDTRMLDDVRLLVYPSYKFVNGVGVVTATIDSEFPYAQDLDQTSTPCSDGVPVQLTNTGSAGYYPVFLVNQLNDVVSAAAVQDFVITVRTYIGTIVATEVQFVYSSSLPGADPISAGGHWAEINCFRNTIYLDGDLTNLKAGVDELNSEYPIFPTGDFEVEIVGCDMDVLWSPAWG